MVWVCEFQHKHESAWAFVVARRKDAIAIGKRLEDKDGFTRVYDSKEFDSLNDGEYHIYKTHEYYFGA